MELLLNCLRYSNNKSKLEDYVKNAKGFCSLDNLTFKLMDVLLDLGEKIKFNEGGKIEMWPAVKQMKEESFNNGADYGALKFANKMVNSHMLTIDQAARELNLTVEEYLAAVKNLKK